MTDRTKRLDRLEARVMDRPAVAAKGEEDRGSRLLTRFRRENIDARHRRRAQWLASATTAQLEARLRRIDFLEEARIQQRERKLSDEVKAAVKEGRPAADWARYPLDPTHAGTKGIRDGDRQKIVNRLLRDLGTGGTASEGFELVKVIREESKTTPTAELLLAAVEATAASKLSRATPHGTG